MKLYTLTHDQLLDLIYDVDMSTTCAEREMLMADFLQRVAPPTRELSPAMEAQYSRQNTDDRGGSNEHAN